MHYALFRGISNVGRPAEFPDTGPGRPCQDGPIYGKMMGSHVELEAGRAEAGLGNHTKSMFALSVPLGSRRLLGVDLCQL
jgi:hypothetical protein